ncbi:hypothetical protein LOTGIDRAFT_175267 [Lottia gigantea]|uniref:Uncharacterized protein n=1 Tax=Lottia gigantea TaxID=225164 RepID=V4ADL7_LOTGI|nr:hypothetical protein LOTGIDRAFT_175267 [Lottia gigantea]ESO94942.1 hypothetical protein LOTGIDRAFT_175267 [Lottia gigantea]
MPRKCIYSDGKGNTVIMPARKTYFKQPTTITQKTTPSILRDPPPATPNEIKTVELTTIGIAGAAIIVFSLLALLLAAMLNRRRKSIRQPVAIVDNNIDHVYDEIGKQGHLRSCFPLMTKKKGEKPRSSQKRPALHPRRTAETNIYDSIEGYGQCRTPHTEIIQTPDSFHSTVELKNIVEQNKAPNPYFELEKEEVIDSQGHEYSANAYFELENENIPGVDCREKTHPGYFQLEKDISIDSDVPNPYFELENELGETHIPSRRRCSCGNRPNIPDQYTRADLYRPNSVPRMHHTVFSHNRKTIDPGSFPNNIDVSWNQDTDCPTKHHELTSVESKFTNISETPDKNHYCILEREADDNFHNDNQVHTINKDVKNVST